MKKKNIFIVFLLSFIMITVGCEDTNQNEESTVVDDEEEIVEETEEETEKDLNEEEEIVEEMEEEESVDLFDKTRNLGAYYYEVSTDLADGTSYIMKVWSSENKIKMESNYPETGETIIMIMDEEEDVMYMYMPVENTAMMMEYDEESAFTGEDGQQGSQDYIDIMKEFADNEEVTIEDGTFEGESVKIVTGEMNGNTNKIWISDKTGFPVKSEFYMNGELESSATFTNFEETSIEPSTFELPEGVVIQDFTNF